MNTEKAIRTISKILMSTNKNAQLRYQTLDRCFRNPGRRYYIEDLVQECNRALLDLDPSSSGVKRRQIYEDIKFMQDSQSYNAPLEKHKYGRRIYYRYEDLHFSINNKPLNEQEAQQLKESLITLSRIKGMPQFEWVEELKIRLEQSFNLTTEETILSFDENQYLKGREYIRDLYQAILNRKVLTINYQSFSSPIDCDMTIHPYHLKQYNNRWFLFGHNEEYKTLTNLALDRIISFQESDIKFEPNTQIDFEEYFEDLIGVTVPLDSKPKKILLKVDPRLWPYIRTKPFHGSQKDQGDNEGFRIVELELHLNYELESLILSFGEKLEVLEPVELREKIAERINALKEKYKV